MHEFWFWVIAIIVGIVIWRIVAANNQKKSSYQLEEDCKKLRDAGASCESCSEPRRHGGNMSCILGSSYKKLYGVCGLYQGPFK